MPDHSELVNAIKFNVIQGRRNKDDEGLEEDLTGRPGVRELVQEALNAGAPVRDILLNGLSDGMKVVGEKFERKEYFIPDMLASAEAVGVAIDVLEPYLVKEGQGLRGKFVLATVKNDQHDIGKNIVGILLKGAGFKVVDLGINVPSAAIVEAARREQADFVGLSALLDTTMCYMGEAIKELEAAGLRDKVRVIIGGAPTSPEFAAKIGADAHCRDAFAAVETAEKMAADF
ncbi:MAG: cobalamin B12-binding domain-containing protein [Bacillota bacterium]